MADAPERIWVDGEFVWPDGEAGGVEYVRADLYDKAAEGFRLSNERIAALEDHVTPATLAEADERLRDAEVRIAALEQEKEVMGQIPAAPYPLSARVLQKHQLSSATDHVSFRWLVEVCSAENEADCTVRDIARMTVEDTSALALLRIPGGPTPEALERWAEWFDNPKNPCPVLNTMRYAPAKLTAGFLLRDIARVMRDLAGGEESLADELRMIEARASAELAEEGC